MALFFSPKYWESGGLRVTLKPLHKTVDGLEHMD